jgi:NAD(P)-dependent dehydrogenase (short-subunit alcohol dehydrogenase family)
MPALSERVALISGAASGIGRGIAERFAEAGAAVAVFDIEGAGAKPVADSLPRAIAIAGDVASETDTSAAVERTVAAFGRLDILVNNAAIERYGAVTDMTPETWDRHMAVNVRGAYLLSRAAIPHMRGRGGNILNIASVHAFVSWPECPAYDASKAGLLGLTRAMAVDHGRDGIRVNAICPGYIQSPMLEQWLRSVPDRDATMASLLKIHPAGRIGTPRDVAEAALFLCSDSAAFITGTTLVVDGGMTIVGH